MTKLMQYNGLKTTRNTVHGVMPLLSSSQLKNNKLEVGNNGWEYDNKTIGVETNGLDTDGFKSSGFSVVIGE